ncbi:MAG: ABC transporter ATP-binding protein [Hyphomicrobiales bacterium]|nr:MAG: ABC transporter ATP-binding protein [Hyphomicrobiales bacterium]
MLEIANLVAGYSGVPVLRGLDLEVARGEVVAILGSNGVGKTTLNKAISGLVPVESGAIRFAGAAIAGLHPSDIVARGLIHVPEGRKIFPNMTVLENLELGSYRRAKPHRRKNLERVFATFPRLKERTHQAAGTLSGGEQQMLAIGRGLMGEPLLLILDEPSLGLSPLLVEEMFGLIAEIAKSGLAVMLVEQNVVQSLEVAARAYVLDNGTVALHGAANDLKNDPRLQTAYLGA